jgi:hypothetical protein
MLKVEQLLALSRGGFVDLLVPRVCVIVLSSEARLCRKQEGRVLEEVSRLWTESKWIVVAHMDL